MGKRVIMLIDGLNVRVPPKQASCFDA